MFLDNVIKKLQEDFGGINSSYVGACLSNISFINNTGNRIKDWLMSPKNILLIHGEPGTSKSYTSCALLDFLVPAFYGDVRLYSESQLYSKVLSSFDDEIRGSWSGKLTARIDAKVVIIDDFGSCLKKDSSSSDVKNFYNEFVQAYINIREMYGPTVITTNFNRREILDIFGERIESRLFAKKNTIIDYKGMPDMRRLLDE